MSELETLRARLAEAERLLREVTPMVRAYRRKHERAFEQAGRKLFIEVAKGHAKTVGRCDRILSAIEATGATDSASVPPLTPEPPPARDVTGRTGPPKPPNTGSNWIPRGYHMRGKP